jgi:hypothetical protein
MFFCTFYALLILKPDPLIKWITKDEDFEIDDFDPLKEEIEQALEGAGSVRPRMNTNYNY